MKKTLFLIAAFLFSVALSAQKIGYVNMETILTALPEYTEAQTTIKSTGEKYKSEVDKAYKVVEEMYNKYQSEKNTLTANMRQSRENEIILKEREVKELQNRYFGQDGEMSKLSQQLLDPINTKVKSVIDSVAEEEGYTMILDVASLAGVIYNNEKEDMSARIIEMLKME